jgi:transcriptional regulator with XRE-family HTH domain
MNVGERIRELREKAEERQETLAKYLQQNGFRKASRQLISAIETGKQQINSKMLITLADHFSVSIDFLLGRIPYQVDRDRQFEQFMLMYRKAVSEHPAIIREYFINSIHEVYWILTRMIERDSKKEMGQFSDLLSRIRVIIYKATDLLNIKTNDINSLLTSLKYLHTETAEIVKDIEALVDNLAIPFENLHKISEIISFTDEFNKQAFDEE